jgi:ATP-dependent RNA helicase DeaD
VAAVVAERTTALLEARLRGRDKLQSERSRRFTPLARGLAESEEELPIITMLLDEYYQQTLHAPVSLPSGKSAPAEKTKKPSWGRNRRK